MGNKIVVQYLIVCLYEGIIMEREEYEVEMGKSIPFQVLSQNIDDSDEDKQDIILDMISKFNSTSTGYMFKGEEMLYHILLPKTK